jgi:transcriptional regulator with XRE-family HTH domain
MQIIIDRVLEFIKSKGWSKSEFARQMGVLPQNVNSYFRGDSDIQKLFIKLSELGCDINWLITGVTEKEKEEKLKDYEKRLKKINRESEI